MKKNRPKYRLQLLTAMKCGVSEARSIAELYRGFLFHSEPPSLSNVEIKLSCRHHDVFVARDWHERNQPIVGMIVLVINYLPNGPVAMIEHPIVAQGYEILSMPLFEKAIKHARQKGVKEVEVIHRVRGTHWPHRKTLQGLGFSSVGCHVQSVSL